ncbi:hypothetical protein [Candidatus Erwinia dacicola]|uniref:Esterase YdiI domain protein n=1 Tax=Candidatus Erwinia dacicola TaxID=252393 RepID=A0A328TLA7_9GAMM|nr:esterase YdiI domain protein [Candidatus Erwinia dacicola]
MVHVGIRFTVLNEESIKALMPVDSQTRQPFGLQHDGASVVLADQWHSVKLLPEHGRSSSAFWAA